MTEKEFNKLKEGDAIKLKQDCFGSAIYKKKGRLVFQRSSVRDEDEFEYGIEISEGSCYLFHFSEYESI
tara:strand:- start:238 stop:444 length:207 start_codon:yes stop_codon:yes gene_type:complete